MSIFKIVTSNGKFYTHGWFFNSNIDTGISYTSKEAALKKIKTYKNASTKKLKDLSIMLDTHPSLIVTWSNIATNWQHAEVVEIELKEIKREKP